MCLLPHPNPLPEGEGIFRGSFIIERGIGAADLPFQRIFALLGSLSPRLSYSYPSLPQFLNVPVGSTRTHLGYVRRPSRFTREESGLPARLRLRTVMPRERPLAPGPDTPPEFRSP